MHVYMHACMHACMHNKHGSTSQASPEELRAVGIETKAQEFEMLFFYFLVENKSINILAVLVVNVRCE